MKSKFESKYFTDLEQRETLSGRFRSNQKSVFKKYEYKNKAVYLGEWKGGFRHGKGTMEWPDGAKYEGSWEFGQAVGEGKFLHADGDIYEGLRLSNN